MGFELGAGFELIAAVSDWQYAFAKQYKAGGNYERIVCAIV